MTKKIGYLLATGLGLAAGQTARADDLGFRYRGGKCVNDAGAAGLNPQVVCPFEIAGGDRRSVGVI